MKHEKLIEKIIEEISTFDDDQLVELNNIFAEENGYHDDKIYPNDETFFENMEVMEAVRAVTYGEYQYPHDWVRYNGYGNLVSIDRLSPDDLCESVDIIADHVADNFTMYDHIFNIDEDEDETDESDEDDDTHLEP